MLDFLSQEVKEIARGLMEANITLNEAHDALKAARELRGLDIGPADWPRLAQATEKLADLEFREGCLRLLNLEREVGKDYKSLLSHFEQLSAEVKEREKLKRGLDSDVEAGREEVRKLKKEVAGSKREAEESRRLTEGELRRNNLVRAEVEATLRLKGELRGKGLDIATIVAVGQELAGCHEEVRGLLGKTKSLLETNEKAKAENERLLSSRVKLLSEKAALEAEVKGLQSKRAQVQEALGKESRVLDSLEELRRTKQRQYDLFEALLAMFSGGTPYQDATPEKLAAAVLKLARGWYAGRPVEEIRGMFISAVCGDYLHSSHCTHCRVRFIADRSPDSYNRYKASYHCPVCGCQSWTGPNDDFLKGLLAEKEFSRCKAL